MVVNYDSYRLILFVFEIVFKFLFENSIGDFSTISLCVGSLQHLFFICFQRISKMRRYVIIKILELYINNKINNKSQGRKRVIEEALRNTELNMANKSHIQV